MKFALPLFVTAAVFAIGAHTELVQLQARTLAQFVNPIVQIDTEVNTISSDLDGYVAGTTSPSVVLADTEDLITLINDLTNAIPSFAALSASDASQLVITIQQLIQDLTTMVDKLIAAKPNFDADGLSGDVLDALYALQTAAAGLADAIAPKVPPAYQDEFAAVAAQIEAQIQRAINAYD